MSPWIYALQVVVVRGISVDTVDTIQIRAVVFSKMREPRLKVTAGPQLKRAH